jgi:hypothetical protein
MTAITRTLPRFPKPPQLSRFVLFEIGIWASIYPIYLAIRGTTITDSNVAVAHAIEVTNLERTLALFHEASLQQLTGFAERFFSAYYMLGFGPLIATVLVWLGLKHRHRYRELRTLLLGSLGLAVIGYVGYPTAPPRLVPSLGISDTVGLSAHDTGSVAGIKFNPYAAMPSMHVGWSVLVGFVGFRTTRNRALRTFFALHPFVMAVTVTATGNHYFLDSIAGAGAAALAVGALVAFRRVPRPA